MARSARRIQFPLHTLNTLIQGTLHTEPFPQRPSPPPKQNPKRPDTVTVLTSYNPSSDFHTPHDPGLCAATLTLNSCSTSGSRPGEQDTSRARIFSRRCLGHSLLQRQGPVGKLSSEVMFRHVGVDRLRQMGWWAAQSPKSQADLERDAAQLGRSMKYAFEQAVASYPGGNPASCASTRTEDSRD